MFFSKFRFSTLLVLSGFFFVPVLRQAPVETPSEAFQKLMTEFDEGLESLNIPSLTYDYREYFNAIPDEAKIQKQEDFFNGIQSKLAAIEKKRLTALNQLHYDHIDFEIRLNLERTALEKAYRKRKPDAIPTNGLSQMEGWYAYRIHFFTSLHITPEELFSFGEKEVARVQGEIKKIQNSLGFKDDDAFYAHLQSDEFYLHDKNKILEYYEEIKKIAFHNLGRMFRDTAIADIAFMEWANAGPFTPPGYYSPRADNAYGTGVFHFNFYDGRHNRRAMDWLFIHEAVPGHHYQWSLRDRLPDQPAFKRQFYYPGNFEGWGAYVEYFGKEIGLYRDPYAELGKWEWDLVRSVRILIDVGIHHYGWSKEEAMNCWKKYIRGQDEIAEREVVRCTNWPAQALSYKVGAWKIQQMADQLKKAHPDSFSLPDFHHTYLMTGASPLEAIEKNMEALMQENL
ncbi:MAG TPA: DUF885 domain-containing protein [Saprospiraceae bacterium]|nr:DUF885 domain-containing protein [Saprospiraceae bacterium]